MTPQHVRARASAMPFNSPAYPLGPYRYENRELLSICYRSDHALLSAVVPEPLLPASDEVLCNFTRIADSTGFGSYHIAAQVIPVLLPGGGGGELYPLHVRRRPSAQRRRARALGFSPKAGGSQPEGRARHPGRAA